MLKHGILGLLSYGELTGYEIREAFESSLNFFWPAQSSQIYRELTALERNGWITKRTVLQSGKPNKNICSITEDGRRELIRWLRDPYLITDMRFPVLMRVFFMGALPVSGSLDILRGLNAQYKLGAEALLQTDASIASYGEKIPDKASTLFWQMASDFGKRYIKMCIEWTDDYIRLLESGEKK